MFVFLFCTQPRLHAARRPLHLIESSAMRTEVLYCAPPCPAMYTKNPLFAEKAPRILPTPPEKEGLARGALNALQPLTHMR